MGVGNFAIGAVARAIPFDNSTDGFVATNVQSAIEEAKASPSLVSAEATATASATAPTGADTLIAGMTLTPVAGTYIVWFSCDITSASAGAAISVSIYAGGVQSTASLRKIIPFSGGTLTTGNARGSMSTHITVTVNGSQAIETRWSTSNAGPTTADRSMTIFKVA